MSIPPPDKTCTKCKQTHPATTEFFYKNSGGKFGVTPRCKPCVNEDNRINHAKRLAKNPEKIRAMASERSMRSYRNNITKSRQRQREHQAKKRADPELRKIINMRKRAGGAGMLPEEFDTMFTEQGHCCAICSSTTPGAKHGWNIDHCHQSREVRFILCAHCNRGLGAFKDDPELMRKAADKLEKYQNQPDQPVHAISER